MTCNGCVLCLLSVYHMKLLDTLVCVLYANDKRVIKWELDKSKELQLPT